MTVINLKIEGLEDFSRDLVRVSGQIRPEIQRAMTRSVNYIKNDAQNIAPYKTGNLRRSIYTEIHDSPMIGVVRVDTNAAPYALGVEGGTKAHVIMPRRSRALFWKGARHPVRLVFHPGTKAKPFMRPAFEKNVDRIKEVFSEALKKIVVSLGNK